LGSQGTVLAGGRYDQLAHTLSFGGKSIPGVGFVFLFLLPLFILFILFYLFIWEAKVTLFFNFN